MIDLDEKIRDAIAGERDDAPLPRPWHEVLERNDHREAHRRRPLALAVAVVAAASAVGLIATLAMRDGRTIHHEPAMVVPAVDPLADLTADDWVVPDPIPDGYERVHAELPYRVDGPAGFEPEFGTRLQIFDDGDGATVRLNVFPDWVDSGNLDGEPIDVDGVQWTRHEERLSDGRPFVVLRRNVGEHLVSIESRGDVDASERFARALVAVPDSAIDFDVLDPNGPFTDVATGTYRGNEVVLRVRELNGYYCDETVLGGRGGSRTSCSHTTTPDEPVAGFGGQSSSARSLISGMAEPDVARFEVVHDGDVTVIEPADESGQFEHRFWIQEIAGQERLLFNASAVTVEYDDGSRVELERSDGEWRVPTGGPSTTGGPTTDALAVDPLADLTADDWVVPDPIPDGYERVHAALRGGGSNARTQEFMNSDGSVILVRTLGRQVEMGGYEPVDVDGVQWRWYDLTELSGRASVGIARNAGSGWVSIHSIGDPAVLQEFALALVTVPDTQIDFEVVDSDRYVDVVTVMTEFGGPTTFRVREVDAHYCSEIEAGDGSTSRSAGSPTGCDVTTAPDVPVQPMLSHGSEGGTVAVGIADPDVARIEFRFDEVVTVVEPTDEPLQFEHRFWIVLGSSETNVWSVDSVTVEYDNGTRVELERSESGTWRVPTS